MYCARILLASLKVHVSYPAHIVFDTTAQLYHIVCLAICTDVNDITFAV